MGVFTMPVGIVFCKECGVRKTSGSDHRRDSSGQYWHFPDWTCRHNQTATCDSCYDRLVETGYVNHKCVVCGRQEEYT